MSAALLALINQRKAQFSRIKTIRPGNGRNRYRILPGWRVVAKAPAHLSDEPGHDGMPSERAMWLEQFYMDFGQHFLKDASGKVVAVALCMDKTYGKPCKVCDEVHRGIENSVDDISLARLEEAKSGASVLLNVLELSGTSPNEVQVLSVAPSVLNGKKGVGGIISLFTDWPNLVALGGTAEGCADIVIDKSGSGKEGTVYNVSAIPTAVTLTAAHMAHVKDLDQHVLNEDNAQSTQRALSSVSAISGLLPAPSGVPLLGAAAAAFVPAVPAGPAVAVTHFDDVPSFPNAAEVASTVPGATQVVQVAAAVAPTTTAPVQPATTVQSPVAPTAPAEQSLEDLLKDL